MTQTPQFSPPPPAPPAAARAGRTRPGGLTAMAVLNFVFAGLAVLGMLLPLIAIVGFYRRDISDWTQDMYEQAKSGDDEGPYGAPSSKVIARPLADPNGSVIAIQGAKSGDGEEPYGAPPSKVIARPQAAPKGSVVAIQGAKSGDDEVPYGAPSSEGIAPTQAGPHWGVLGIRVVLGLAACSFLIVSGVGYLRMARGSGYVMGHVYAIIGIVDALLALFAGLGGGLAVFLLLIGLAWPVLTLILLNTSFKRCFSAGAAQVSPR